MVEDTWTKLEARFARSPILAGGPVPEHEVDGIPARLGRPLPPDYRQFVLRYGGAMVGAYPILGVRQAEVMGATTWNVVEVNERYRKEGWPLVDELLVVSVDHSGNPIGIAEDGRVLVWDHDVRQSFELADSFESFLRLKCLKLTET